MLALIRDNEGLTLTRREAPGDPGNLTEVRVELVGLCWTDLWVAEGSLEAPYPIVLGHEACGRLESGQQVAIFPWWDDLQLGISRDGLLVDRQWLPSSLLVPLPQEVDPRRVAYAEPICAALGVLESGIVPGQRGLVVGRDRLAQLLYRLLRHQGFDRVDLDQPRGRDYDFVVEGDEPLEALVDLLVPRGRLLLKRRLRGRLPLERWQLLKKEIRLEFCFYGDFARAVDLACELPLEDLFGPTYELAGYQEAFQQATRLEGQKVFIRCAES